MTHNTRNPGSNPISALVHSGWLQHFFYGPNCYFLVGVSQGWVWHTIPTRPSSTAWWARTTACSPLWDGETASHLAQLNAMATEAFKIIGISRDEVESVGLSLSHRRQVCGLCVLSHLHDIKIHTVHTYSTCIQYMHTVHAYSTYIQYIYISTDFILRYRTLYRVVVLPKQFLGKCYTG